MKYIKDWFVKLTLVKKITLIILIAAFGYLTYASIFLNKQGAIKYQTAKAEKGALVVTVSGSGQVSTANNGTITTQASGVVSKLYVKDADEVKTGDKIAEIDLDLTGQQASAQALASFQTAKSNLEAAKANMYPTQSDMFSKWKTFMDLAQNSTYQNSDGMPNDVNRALPQFHIAQDDWLSTEAKYKNQQNIVNQAQTAYNSAWMLYQQISPTILAPISGTVSGLSLQVGSVITVSQTTNTQNNTTSQSATKIASIKTKALPNVSVNLTEIDVPKIKIGDKATVKFDAFPDKTYTGKVVSMDTAGTTSSGVTTYPTVIRLDTQSSNILPNMAASASIITYTKDNVLSVPSSAVQNQNGASYVRILKNGKLVQIPVETGLSSDTQIEIMSGLSEGNTVVTSVNPASSTTQQRGQTSSPFGGFGGGAAFRLGAGGGGGRRD